MVTSDGVWPWLVVGESGQFNRRRARLASDSSYNPPLSIGYVLHRSGGLPDIFHEEANLQFIHGNAIRTTPAGTGIPPVRHDISNF
jgi:hypothetical protein